MRFRGLILVGLSAYLVANAAPASAGVIFSDDFNSGASALWGDEVGNWVVAGGAYVAGSPNNFPNAFSSLPFGLADFSIDVDVNGVFDGGIWLRSTAKPGTTVGIEGVLFVMAGGSSYWHIVTDGSSYGPSLSFVAGPPLGSDAHIHIEVLGDTYSAFLNGSAMPFTTLTTSAFASGRVALYSNSGQRFDNVVLATTGVVPEPISIILAATGLVGIPAYRRLRAAKKRA